MPRIGRYESSQLTLSRFNSAIKNRIDEIPHYIAWNFNSYAKENRKRIFEFHNIHKGKRCFVVANGPSIAKTDLELLRNEYSFGLNRIYLYFDKSSFRPTYFVAVNELILEQFSHEINKLKMPKFLNWNRRVLFNSADRSVLFLKSKMVFKDEFQKDIVQPLVVGGTVTFVALQIAYYMGFNEIVLVGLDHTYNEKGIPSVTVTRTEEKDLSHFHSEYFPKGIRWQPPDLVRSELDFSLALQNYNQAGRTIIDATIGGNCPVFEKADYYSLFK